jgi:hypothetical protein
MKVPANVTGEKLILDYLSRVTQAATRYLPKGARIAFVGRTRARIEREAGRVGLSDPARIMEVLAAMGEPEDLVRAERARIDAAWIKRNDPAGAEAAESVTEPRAQRAITSRWRPATDKPPARGPGSSPASRLKPVRDKTGRDKTGRDKTGRDKTGRGREPAPARDTGPQRGPGGERDARGPGDAQGPEVKGEPPGTQGSQGSKPTLVDTSRPPRPPRPSTADWLEAAGRRMVALAREHPLEAIAVVLMGVGGLILPLQFWVPAVVVSMLSKLWDNKDKLAAVIGPYLVMMVGSIVTALVVGGNENVVAIYFHAIHIDFSDMLRVGCLFTAIYLGWRVHRGRRPDKPPPWKRYQ